MNQSGKVFWLFINVAIALGVGLASVLIARNSSLLNAPDRWFNDWRAAYFGDKIDGARNDLAVVLISEDTLSKYPYPTSLDRRYLAKLLLALDEAEPSGIGLDFIFDHPTEQEKDAELIDTIKNLKTRVVLGVIDLRSPRITQAELGYQENFLKATKRAHGHVYLSMEGGRLNTDDSTVRFIPAGSNISEKSFSSVLSSSSQKDEFLIAWLNAQTFDVGSPFAVISLPPVSPDAVSRDVFPETLKELIKGRTVLVGGNFSERDQHLTPFSVWNRSRSPGVLVHAHAFAQLKDGRSWKFAPLMLEVIYSAILAWLGYLLVSRITFAPETFLRIIAVFASFGVMIILFRYAKIILPLDAPIYAVTVGAALGKFLPKNILSTLNAMNWGVNQ